VDIDTRLNQQIMPSLQMLKRDINAENPTSETLYELRQKLIAADANIHDIAAMLKGYLNFHPANLHAMKSLTNTHNKIIESIDNMQKEITKLHQEFAQLKSESKDRKKQALTEIEGLIQDANDCLNRVESGLSAVSTPLNFNSQAQLSKSLKEFSIDIEKFYHNVTKINGKMLTQSHLFHNAEITQHVTRFGVHPSRMNFSARQTSVNSEPSLPQDEKKLAL
jgi:DNA repair exonuclease SbcCD ATPase subunit